MSTNREDLGRLLSDMPEDVAADVLDFARERMTRRSGEAVLAAILADPVKRAEFDAGLGRAYERASRGEALDGDAVMDDLMAGLPE